MIGIQCEVLLFSDQLDSGVTLVLQRGERALLEDALCDDDELDKRGNIAVCPSVLVSKMLVKKAPRFRNGILNCGEFFRPSRTTDNNLLPSTFPSDCALPRTVLVSNKPVL